MTPEQFNNLKAGDVVYHMPHYFPADGPHEYAFSYSHMDGWGMFDRKMKHSRPCVGMAPKDVWFKPQEALQATASNLRELAAKMDRMAKEAIG